MTVSGAIKAQWHDLITDAQAASGMQLHTSVENYLINTLISYTQRPDIAERVFAIDYLLAHHEKNHSRQLQLRELADQCLLYAGLFPQYAKRHNVNVSYYIDIGRSAYFDLSTIKNSISSLFVELSESFITLMQTLLAIQIIKNDHANDLLLVPLQNLETACQYDSTNVINLTTKLRDKY